MLYIVGLGPGDKDLMTKECLEVLDQVEIIVGYKTYIALIEDLIGGKEVYSTGMKGEIDRCQKAIELAKDTGKDIAVVCSGDSGIYAMAGLIFELLASQEEDIPVKVIPGLSAGIAGAANLGAPLMNDFCFISLSDLMTPWAMIEKRLHAAAQGDFVICLYNPRSKGRPKHLAKALEIIKSYKGGDIVVGIVKDVGRKEEETIITTIDELDEEVVDMTTTVIVGNRFTKVYKNWMYTPRGYEDKYGI
ncbi:MULTISPECIES: precorrin-3B C(17)-methyltransferase [Aerococcus]|uniref:precorrin-3B C(17)-methyltransferase n=1 Tax=Aerococcus urinae (strain CCUG 59500 / ACS-120-V-Col10a) TaxID=2976812 RepID=UPI000200E7C0|nr:precorrin-3B C(17)-methyltransferase [Aerococcus sp. Group 1]AEA00669.1 precorrin-3B C(17)-methyltransferase [Aerococcus sp. Group 1]MCY3030026.1 precorrin-3B C(17)-methyltransferase [Aerococcus sp. Group 1]MCY3054767.1 precorrin-3B C(17)-methyltransferase [Aerococcus sp. Group 1]MCY3056497.1 precorrin-3B C(17)-methyltransferase [Aerococcus sp. Group 1]MCY3061176.1 precorrin-3B C(17)-methyltransferase [Aerococcus sp. Group 1]